MNTFGEALRVTTFGESHGAGIGCVIDGFPSGIHINTNLINHDLQRRQGGKNRYTTQRKEDDCFEILSGVFEGVSTGMPIALFVKNTNTKSKDYDNIKDIFRPGHADFSYFVKYGLRDYRGGGRSSARESVARVASGAFAKMLLGEFGIICESGSLGVGECMGESIDFDFARESEIFALDKQKESIQKDLIMHARSTHDSIGGCALIRAFGNKKILQGLGEPLYYKLDGAIGAMMMGLNGVKAVEIGDGIAASQTCGSRNNDMMNENGFLSNHAGGILGGIATGEEINVRVYFKPTPSIFAMQQTIDIYGNKQDFELKGRHDPCIAVRGSVVCESMLALILADMLLLHTKSSLANLKKIYAEFK